MSKYIFITGGVTSSLGKGIIAAALAKILQSRGLSVIIQKFDPYINIDPGTLNPYEHGECYVTDDGAETDLDLGHYERFLGILTSAANSVTTGQIYKTVIQKEREGCFLGKTVQVIPHITDEIKYRFSLLGEHQGLADIVITEIGGTVGDLESQPYIEAIRQFKWERGSEDVVLIHLTYVPFLKSSQELKTKPVQHSVRMLSQYGLHPDVVVCRAEYALTREVREKVALFCNVRRDAVIEAIDVATIYEVPLHILREKLDLSCLHRLHIGDYKDPDLASWDRFLHQVKYPKYKVAIGLIGKYTELPDAYKSILEAFVHAGAKHSTKVEIIFLQSDQITKENVAYKLQGLAGIVVAPGFGTRGIQGKIYSVQYARENGIPFLGICLGFQVACVEFARNKLGLLEASSTEVDPDTPDPVIDLLPGQGGITQKGGTMRLGGYQCVLVPSTKAHHIYGKGEIRERHRHRYEFNDRYLPHFEREGFVASGRDADSHLVEIMEYVHHPFFMGVQFHPEYSSTAEHSHPLFLSFVQVAKDRSL